MRFNFLFSLSLLLSISYSCKKIENDNLYNIRFKESTLAPVIGQEYRAEVVFSGKYHYKGKLFFKADAPNSVEIVETGDDYVVIKVLKPLPFRLSVVLVSQGEINSEATVDVNPSYGALTDKIVYSAYSANAFSNTYQSDIFSISPQGGAAVPITNTYFIESNPAISADGKTLLYIKSSSIYKYDLTTLKESAFQLSSYNNSTYYNKVNYTVDGASVTASNTNISGNASYNQKSYVFTSSGAKVSASFPGLGTYTTDIYMHSRTSPMKAVYVKKESTNNQDIEYLYFANSGDKGVLLETTTSGVSINGPKVSPSGEYVVYERASGSFSNLYLVNINSGITTQLTSSSNRFNKEAFFSPDGSKIIYSSNIDGDYDLYIMDIASKAITQLTNTTNITESSPVWN